MDRRHLTILLLGASVGLVEAYYRYRQIDRKKYSKIISDWFFSVSNEDSSTKDLLDALPDEIVSFIFSLLSPREAVRISVLSKRLGRLYASLPNLNFDSFAFFMPRPFLNNKYLVVYEKPHFCLYATPKFVKVVDSSLKSYAGPNISSFRISFCYRRLYSRNVDWWISWAIGMGARKLDLELVCFDNPFCDNVYDYTITELYAFSCERLFEAPVKLKHLRLHSCILLPHPTSQRFTTLTVLDLNYISLVHGELCDMLSSCSNLEWLSLRKCALPHKVHISGLSSLEFLSVNSCKDVKEIELLAVNLTTFELAGMELDKLLFSWVPKLKIVHLALSQRRLRERCLYTLSVDLPQLETLTFSLYTPKTKYVLTTFSNVLQLNLFVWMEEKYYDFTWSIYPLLRAFPSLQKLCIMLPLYSRIHDNVWRGDVRTTRTMELPRYSFPQLREVVFTGFQGTKSHIESAAYVLENAVALEQMILDATVIDDVQCGLWCVFPHFSDESFKLNRVRFHSQLQGKNISKNAKLIIKPGHKGYYLPRELIAKVW